MAASDDGPGFVGALLTSILEFGWGALGAGVVSVALIGFGLAVEDGNVPLIASPAIGVGFGLAFRLRGINPGPFYLVGVAFLLGLVHFLVIANVFGDDVVLASWPLRRGPPVGLLLLGAIAAVLIPRSDR